MNAWLIADIALLLGVVICGVLMLRSPEPGDWLVGLQLGGTIAVLVLMLLAQAMKRPSFYDLALALALLSYPSGLIFARFVERWFR